MASIRVDTLQDGSRRYRVRVRMHGVLRSGTFRRKAEATRFAGREEEELSLSGRDAHANSRVRTFAALADRYERFRLTRKSSHTRRVQEQQLDVWRRLFDGMTLAEITPAVVAEAAQSLIELDFSPATANRYLSLLSHMFSRAVKEWNWCPVNPVANIDRFPEPEGRVRFLSSGERARLLLMCRSSRSEHLYLAVLLTLATGMRLNEVRQLTWDRVDLERSRVLLDKTKTKTRRGVAVSGLALQLLQERYEHRDLNSRFVFPAPTNPRHQAADFRTAWQRALQRARVADFRFHDLRHTTASYLAQQGNSTMEIAEVLGHKTLAMVKRYSHLTEGHSAGALQRMTARVIPERRP